MIKKILLTFFTAIFILTNLSAQVFNGNSIIYNDNSIITTPNLTNNGDFIAINDATVEVSNNLVNNSNLSLVNGSDLTVTNNITNSDTIFSHVGLINVGGDYLGSTGAIIINDTLSGFEIAGNFQNVTGKLVQDATSYFQLDGFDQIADFSVLEDYLGTLVIDGGGDKIFNNFVLVRDLELNDGIIKLDQSGDTLLVFSDEMITSGDASSHVQGPLFMMIPPTYSEEIRFPLGYINGGGANLFAPIETDGFIAGSDSSLFKAQAIDGTVSGLVKLGLVETIYSDNYWELLDFQTEGHSSYKMKLYADESLVGSAPSSWVVTQSNSNTTGAVFQSLGRSNFLSAGDTSNVVSNRDYQGHYLAIGARCVTAKLAVDLAMEGVTGTSPVYQSFLDSLFVDGETVSGITITDLASTLNPQTIDLVNVYIRDQTTPSLIVDSTKAWLVSGGGLVDYEMGTNGFVEFCPRVGGVQLGEDYYVEVNHRNHLPIINSNTNLWTATVANPTPLTSVDFTDPTSHYSLGGYKAGVNAEMLAGNASNLGSSYNKITPLDIQYTVWRMSQLPANGYSVEDLNLDGTVNTVDYNLVRDNSVFSRRAVLPY